MKKLNENIKRFTGKKLEVISFRRLNGEIGMHLNIRVDNIPTLIQDIFICSSYNDCVEYHFLDDDSKKLIIEIVEVNDYNQVTRCVVVGSQKHIDSFLVADGEATPNNPIDFKTVEFPEELRNAISTFEFMIDEIKEKINELASQI